MINVLTIYYLLSEIAKTSTAPYQINTFAVLKDNADLNTDNLQKTLDYLRHDSSVFYSRAMDDTPAPHSVAWSFPALIVNQNTVNLRDPYQAKGERIYNLDLHLLFEASNIPFEYQDHAAEQAMMTVIRRFAECKYVDKWLLPEAAEGKAGRRMYQAIQNKMSGQLERIEQHFTNHKAVGVSFQMSIATPNCL